MSVRVQILPSHNNLNNLNSDTQQVFQSVFTTHEVTITFLLRISMQYMQNVILFYPFCLSFSLSNV